MGRTITPQCPVNPKEQILRQVLGFRSVSCEPVANIKHAPGVSAHKFLPGRPVALEALLDQLGVLLQRIVSLIACYGARRASESATLSVASLAVHLGLPTMERKLPSKCSRAVRPLPRPTVMLGILLSNPPRDKKIKYRGRACPVAAYGLLV